MKSKKRALGYTLLEVMIAVSIVSMLAASSYPSYQQFREDSQIKEAETDLGVISAAILELAWDTGEFPRGIRRNIIGDWETWDLSSSYSGLLTNDGRFNDWQGPYLREIPLDPWGSPYFFDPDYRIDGVICSVVGSFGPNGSGRNRYDDDDIYTVIKTP